jgi:hypothetical protein
MGGRQRIRAGDGVGPGESSDSTRNLPGSAATKLTDAGHDVDAVAEEQLTGAPDPDVVTAAGRILISLDRGLGDHRAYPPGRLRHRLRARCEDRIRCAKDTGLRTSPLHGFAQNQIWCEIIAMASDLLAWTATLAVDGEARRWGT